MILLPRGIPLKEKIDPGKVNLPDALRKLHAGKFSGYLRFDTKGGTGIFIYDKGRFISALFEGERERQIAYDALAAVFEQSLLGGAHLDIYRLSPDLALSVHALLHGTVLYRGQEVKLIDIRSLLGKLREETFSGCLRIYTEERIALIFYREGSPLGFFHDGSTEIEKTADTSMSVARLPGAKIDVLAVRGGDDPVFADLAESADLGALWRKTQEQVARRRLKDQEDLARREEIRQRERRQKTLVLFQEIAARHLGKIGSSLAGKEFEKAVPPQKVSEESLGEFYERLARSARLVSGIATVNTMIDDMKKGIGEESKLP